MYGETYRHPNSFGSLKNEQASLPESPVCKHTATAPSSSAIVHGRILNSCNNGCWADADM